jgi:DNA-binding NtrC family response regulator
MRGEEGGNMISLDAVATRLPIVLVVDPVAASRQAMWRSLSRSFGVLEAPDARHARDWLARRPNIDALVVQKELPDADSGEFVGSLLAARASVASRVILVSRPVDLRMVLKSLVGWFFSRDVRKAEALLREADRFVS